MRNIMLKEIKLSASPLAFLFIAFGLMFFIPGYPILCGAFFVTLGLFQSFQTAREANDIVFSALLPIAKNDVVKGKYLFVCFIEACALALMTVAAVIRMTALADAPAYRANALMTANPFALGMALVIIGAFLLVWVCGASAEWQLYTVIAVTALLDGGGAWLLGRMEKKSARLTDSPEKSGIWMKIQNWMDKGIE